MNIYEIDFTNYNLNEAFFELLDTNKIYWHDESDPDQICLNSVKDKTHDIHYGRGSLFLDWDNSYNENGKLVVPPRKQPLKEEDFSELCDVFVGTVFEKLYKELQTKYKIGRVRFMYSNPKTCLTWHIDNTPRVHFPIKTQEGCFMIIENEIKHLEVGKCYYTNTLKKHTAMNASTENRIHLVATVLS